MESRKHIDPERVKLLAAKLKLWLLDLLLWLSEWMGSALPRDARIMLRDDIRDALACARMLVCTLALARWTEAHVLPPDPRRTTRPHGTAPGFRCAAPDNDVRGLRRAVRLRGRTIAARLAEVRDILDDLETWAQRVCVRLAAPAPGARLVLCFVVGDRVLGLTTPAPVFADSS